MSRTFLRNCLATLALFLASTSLLLAKDTAGFVKVQGQKIVDADGHEVFLRCTGLGDWLLSEGYMWRFGKKAGRPRTIEKMIVEMVGEKKAKEFWKEFHESFITEADVKGMKEVGFNAVRPAMNARLFMTETGPVRFHEENFKLLDRFIGWCEKYGIYVILDMHGTPGGQTGENIDDSINDKPELFTDPANQDRTIQLWKKFAARYKDNKTVIAYDLLNEPVPEKNKELNPQLVKFYARLIEEIRKVDPNHMITLEGANWATDWSIFTKPMPSNVFLQFHKYWNGNEQKDIQGYLDKRTELNVPIWCGESGENSDNWYRASFRLLEKNDIGWCLWTWKKLDSNNNPYSIKAPANWERIVMFSNPGGPKPSPEIAWPILQEFLKNMRFENCVYHTSAVNAVFGR
jgi:aryl-phospho-beta-D-glucosidase BglC (GH1 family)